jgi:Cd2+/Zn2+-exporting ATPase/Cu+-exporting ATPase
LREGAIIKGGLYLELLSSVDTVVFDKTGTLTLGNPEVILIMAADGHSEHDVLQTATVAEQRSENPSGKAIVKKATESQLEIPAPEEFKYVPGKGIECRVDHRRILVGNGAFLRDNNIVLNGAGSSADPSSEILVVRDGVHFGAIQIADTLRPEAKESVAALHALGLRTVLLTGDAKASQSRLPRRSALMSFTPKSSPIRRVKSSSNW